MQTVGARRTALGLLLAAAVGWGCASRRPPATVLDLERYTEKGRASWYGEPYHGRATASGERYDMHAMTAAHRTLPFGTVVRVTNLENGRSVRLRITDRGPFKKGRIIDLSYAAAKKLNMIGPGVVKVRVEVVRRP